jgi:hypothetical protein
MFGLAPLFLLAAAYFVAGLILRSGWKVFLPGTNTPFAPIDGFAVFYFGAGRLLYYGTPILIGWGIGFTTARQRLMTIWPTVGSVLIALIGGFSRVRASRPAAPGRVGHISMDLTLGPSVQDISHGLFRALVILSLTLLPYVIWPITEGPLPLHLVAYSPAGGWDNRI